VEPTDRDRTLVLVVGAGRSGTSVITGVLGLLGFRVPQPEVMANATNPRGFGEPRWVVDFHARLMRGRRISLFDARPAAWDAAARAAASPAHLHTLREWLAGEFDGHDRLVVKDPRTSWFLPLWTTSAAELGAHASFVTMLRHPSEVLTSIRTTAGEPPNEAGRAAWWLNMMLQTELVTRPFPRSYVHYDRLLADWRGELSRVGGALGDPRIADPSAEAAAEIDGLVDPGLRRSATGWERVTVAGPVRDLAEETWHALSRLAEPQGDTAQLREQLDRLRESYQRLYADAEAVAESSVKAARDSGRRSAAKAVGSGAAPPARGRGAGGLRRGWSRAVRRARRLLPG
jgi:hypothetical protein